MSGWRGPWPGGLLAPPAAPWRKSSTGSTGSSGSEASTASTGSDASVLSTLSDASLDSLGSTGGLSCGCEACPGVGAAPRAGVSLRFVPLEGAAEGRELWCRQRLGHHPHLQECVCATPTVGGVLLALEAAPCGDLAAFLRMGGVGEERARGVAKQVGAALRHVHARGLVHGDLQPRHVLVLDRSLTTFRLGGLHALTPAGAVVPPGPRGALAPPEVRAAGGDPYTAHPAQDAWQLGLLLVACLTGALPWAAADPADPHYAAWAAWASGRSTRLPAGLRMFTPRFRRLLRRLLHPDPARRRPVHALDKYLRDPWLARRDAVPALLARLAHAPRGLAKALTTLTTRLTTHAHAPRAKDAAKDATTATATPTATATSVTLAATFLPTPLDAATPTRLDPVTASPANTPFSTPPTSTFATPLSTPPATPPTTPIIRITPPKSSPLTAALTLS
ncbi:serine/threonine-protein kinase SBK1-like [Eriocheir sinensis]|uniref:serine/threonine-protein kinase SBK1-like n=1 Tax=Eriocheir sinensis TaxID=95602 RepID=UPI0021C893A7|nr:serine/threonine-protein kinase SBK1-like [Eriocheir sinensis]